jgi:hypothetical protein
MLLQKEYFVELLYHPLIACGPIPTVEDPEGVYPYESYSETSKRPIIKKFKMLSMENEYLKVEICPDLGGKIYSLFDKRSQKEILYNPGAVRPVRILPRMAFISGGIEVSFPISHTPVQLEQVDYMVKTIEDRIYVWCGERELRYGMQWSVEFSLGAEDDFLTQRTLFYNQTSKSHAWMSWSNAALEAKEDTEMHFPKGEVLYHGDKLKTIDWQKDGPKVMSDINRMAGFFWEKAEYNAFGAYTPSLGYGLYHIADRTEMPGIKLWVYGKGKDEMWSHVSGLRKQSYLEIQAGPIKDQSIKHDLAPGERHLHTEYWIPSTKPLDISSLKVPRTNLISDKNIPLFDFINRPKTTVWLKLLKAYEEQNAEALPLPPEAFSNVWPPCGMYQLESAIKWAVHNSLKEQQELWKYYLAVWHAGCGEKELALFNLKDTNLDLARALEARLLRRRNQDYEGALKSLLSIKAEAVALHPQVVIERDIVLAHFKDRYLNERKLWLNQVNSLEDDGLIERRAFYLFDTGKKQEAMELLANTKFELVHQRYERTALWQKLNVELGSSSVTPPDSLGEDDLAVFGAYRTS